MKNYTTPEEIRAAFIAEGWKDPNFRQLTEEERAKFTPKPDKVLYMMLQTGDIYDAAGNIYCFNIKPANYKKEEKTA